MRMRENEVELIARLVAKRLLGAECIELQADEEELEARIRKAIHDDLMVEENLNREVEEILRGHMKDIEQGSIDYRKMFSMIKHKLARDRNLILS